MSVLKVDKLEGRRDTSHVELPIGSFGDGFVKKSDQLNPDVQRIFLSGGKSWEYSISGNDGDAIREITIHTGIVGQVHRIVAWLTDDPTPSMVETSNPPANTPRTFWDVSTDLNGDATFRIDNSGGIHQEWFLSAMDLGEIANIRVVVNLGS